ncbi:hypothetical protein AHF37_05435 [Paragonimus kellicotti]|nr:hypothetical protein AHF37_05435 [Paragonimus kellicotti]
MSTLQTAKPNSDSSQLDTAGRAARNAGRIQRTIVRMDYEKMARAMRFYYKDSILRKIRQQLHFQFAMPYVEWAEKCYKSTSSSHRA